MLSFEILRSNEKVKLEEFYSHVFGQMKFVCDRLKVLLNQGNSTQPLNCFDLSDYNMSEVESVMRVRRLIQIVQASYPEDYQKSIEFEITRLISKTVTLDSILKQNIDFIYEYILDMYEIHNYYVHNIFVAREVQAPYFLLVFKYNNVPAGMIWLHLSDGSGAYDSNEEELLKRFGRLIPPIQTDYATMIGIGTTVPYVLARLAGSLPRISEHLIPKVIQLAKSFKIKRLYVSPVERMRQILTTYYGFKPTPTKKELVHIMGWGTWSWLWKDEKDLDEQVARGIPEDQLELFEEPGMILFKDL